MTETYTSGRWTVKSGEEHAFVQEWTSFVTWASSLPGSGRFSLVRDLDNPGQYMSFGSWEGFEAQEAWKNHAEFTDRLGRVRSHCDEFKSFTMELVTEVA